MEGFAESFSFGKKGVVDNVEVLLIRDKNWHCITNRYCKIWVCVCDMGSELVIGLVQK